MLHAAQLAEKHAHLVRALGGAREPTYQDKARHRTRREQTEESDLVNVAQSARHRREEGRARRVPPDPYRR